MSQEKKYGNFYTLTREGAEELANTIRQFWKDKGKEVDVWLEPFTQTYANKNLRALYSVRSNMINGLPK